MFRTIILFCFISFLLSCQDNAVVSEAEKIVNASIEAHGGLNHWQSISQMEFRKKTWLYKADNSLEKYSDELHTLQTEDDLSGLIKPYDPTDLSYHIKYSNGKGFKNMVDTTVDGTNAFLSSHFVVNQPFKMLDAGVELSYLGKETLENEKIVDVVKAFYGDKEDVWWFYFDAESHVLASTLIYHAPTYAYVVNEEIKEVDGLLWNTKRTTYRTDSLRNIEYVRAKFEYSEIEMLQ